MAIAMHNTDQPRSFKASVKEAPPFILTRESCSFLSVASNNTEEAADVAIVIAPPRAIERILGTTGCILSTDFEPESEDRKDEIFMIFLNLEDAKMIVTL